MLGKLTTEARNPASEDLDSLSALEIVRLMNAEDALVAQAVGRVADAIARAVEAVAARLRAGGRLIYVGAGTSGRLGVLDASECPPTFHTRPEQVVGIIAGGPGAMFRSVEGAEDRPEQAAADMKSLGVCGRDAVVGIATSGRTPYVIGAMEHARAQGAFTIALACNAEASLSRHADLAITAVVGPEVLSGSTRLKAGTATKMVLNMISTGAMILLGKTYGNLMVDLRASNSKLTDRARRIVAAVTGVSESEAEPLLAHCDGEVKTAIVAHLCSVSPEEARRLLEQAGGHLRQTLSRHRAASAKTEQRRNEDTPAGDLPQSVVISSTASCELVLGIDGGATKTVAWLAPRTPSADKQFVGRGVAGPSNLQAVNRAEVLENLDRAISGAFADARVRPGPVAAAVFALAGSDRDDARQVFHRWAEDRQVAPHVAVVHDAMPVLFAASPEGWGVALIAGTGSLCFGRSPDGRTARAGGWGFLFGDEGSAYAIAVAALRAAAQAADGRGPSTLILPALLGRFDIPDAKALVAAVYPQAADRAAIAALAEVVTSAAGQGDPVAQQILDQAAGQLADMVAAVVRELGFSGARFPLALTGGLLLGDEAVRYQLATRLESRGLCPAPITTVSDPVAGAVNLARELLAKPQSIDLSPRQSSGLRDCSARSWERP